MSALSGTWRPPSLAAKVALALLTLFLPGAVAPDPLIGQDMTSEARIRDLRAASNAALEAHDVEGFMASIDPDYVGTAGNGGHVRSRDELRALITGLASEEEPYGWFVRTPDRVEVDASGGRAFETGRWVQRTREGEEVTEGIGGRYTAYWRRVGGRWMIHGEVFVTLSGGPTGR